MPNDSKLYLLYWLRKYETAIADHEWIGSQPVEYHRQIKRNLKESKKKVYDLIDAICKSIPQ
jgi:hypothetical protein